MGKRKAATKTLLTPDEERRLQPALLDVPAVDFVAKLEATGDYTGERLAVQRPEAYERVIMLLSQGHGSQYIQDQTGISKNTVKAVRKREGETIDLLKARIAERNFDLADLSFEAASLVLSEIMSSPARRSAMTVKDVQGLAITGGIAVQNGQLLTGKPTAHVGVELFSAPTPDFEAQIAAHIAGLKSAATHLVGEKTEQKGPGDLERNGHDDGGLALAALPAPPAVSDGQSPEPVTQPAQSQA